MNWNSQLYENKHTFIWKYGEALLTLLDAKPGEAILDLGCGTGHLTAQIANVGASVVGLDQSDEMLAQARASYPDLRFEIGDARFLTAVNTYDAVFSNAVLHWIHEPDLVAAGLHRALRPGGRFVAELGGKGNIAQIVKAIHAAVQNLKLPPIDQPWYYPSVGEYTGILERHGLEVTFATLFDRFTPLEGEGGLRHWIEMFGKKFLLEIPAKFHEEFFRHIEHALRPTLYRDGIWHADYRRLRIVAIKRA